MNTQPGSRFFDFAQLMSYGFNTRSNPYQLIWTPVIPDESIPTSMRAQKRLRFIDIKSELPNLTKSMFFVSFTSQN